MKAVILGALVYSTVVSAQAVTVKGSASCGEWAQKRSSGSALVYEFWMMGFLSGVVAESNKDALAGVDSSSIALWVDQYCQRNPLEDTSSAGYALFKELVRRKGMR